MSQEQLPALRAIHNMVHPEGLVTHPRPASGIAHMARPRSPIHLDSGGWLNDLLGIGLDAGIGALGGLAGEETSVGRPTQATLQQTNNPFAVPLVDRTVDPVTKAVTMHVLGYQAWPGSKTPSSTAGGLFGNFAPGSTYQTNGNLISPSVPAGGMTASASPTSRTVGYVPGAGASYAAAPVTSGFLSPSGHGVSSGVGHKRCGGIVGRAEGGPPPQGMPQDGQPASPQDQQLFMAAVQALSGQSPNPKVAIAMFIKRYGPQALIELQHHLQGVPQGQGISQGQAMPPMQPGASNAQPGPPQQASGGMIPGPGDGMSDSVPAQVSETGTPLTVSKDEFVVPADVISMLGNGSSAAGAAKMHQGIAKLRNQKYGRAKQPPRTSGNPVLG